MDDKTPRTAKEAIYAEMLGDLTTIIDRVEALPELLSRAEAQLESASKTLNAASDKYRASVGEFTDKARQALSAQLEQKARESADDVTAELQGVVQTQVREAFASTVRADVSELVVALRAAASEHRKTARQRTAELLAVSVGTALCTAAVLFVLLQAR